MLPPILILLTILAAGAMAWGCDPSIVDLAGGTGMIRWMYRLQWLFIGVTVAGALSLVGLVVSGKRRGWWLIGLIPVIVLFVWRFAVSPNRPGAVDDQPSFVQMRQAGWISDNDAVIGVVASGQSYAFSLAALHHAPVVVITQRDRRLIIVWSERAGVASACWVDRTIRGRDLRVVTNPRGVLLLFNTRVGEFFDGLTLRQSSGAPLTGFVQRIPAEITAWEKWKSIHSETLVLQPRWPLGPALPVPPRRDDAMIYVATDPSIVVPAARLGGEPLNVVNGASAAVLYRDGGFGRVIGLDRRIEQDLFPRFALNSNRSRKRVSLIDSDTDSGWTWTGECVEGAMKGVRLKPLIVIENVPPDAAEFWVK